MEPDREVNTLEVAPGLVVEDHGDNFFLVFEGDGHDLTVSLENQVARRIATFIAERMREAESRN